MGGEIVTIRLETSFTMPREGGLKAVMEKNGI